MFSYDLSSCEEYVNTSLSLSQWIEKKKKIFFLVSNHDMSEDGELNHTRYCCSANTYPEAFS